MSDYFLGQGKMYIAARDASGNPLAQRWMGDVSAAKVSLKVKKVQQQESFTGQRSIVKSISLDKDANIDLTLLEISAENLALALFGKSVTIGSSSVTGEAMPVDLISGDRISLKYPQVTSVVVTDSSATPVVMNASKYMIDAAYGAIVLTDVTGFTQPFKVAYTHAAIENVSIFSAVQSEVFLRYEGINLAENGAPIIVELYRVSTEPLKDLPLITEKISDMNLSAAVMIDVSKPASDEMGQFGRIMKVKPL
ncbi:MAG: hypothetical protein K2P84_00080 [Undibacterium sp.]|nr:hypothetical protein [Undibacterium sp.]